MIVPQECINLLDKVTVTIPFQQRNLCSLSQYFCSCAKKTFLVFSPMVLSQSITYRGRRNHMFFRLDIITIPSSKIHYTRNHHHNGEGMKRNDLPWIILISTLLLSISCDLFSGLPKSDQTPSLTDAPSLRLRTAIGRVGANHFCDRVCSRL